MFFLMPLAVSISLDSDDSESDSLELKLSLVSSLVLSSKFLSSCMRCLIPPFLPFFLMRWCFLLPFCRMFFLICLPATWADSEDSESESESDSLSESANPPSLVLSLVPSLVLLLVPSDSSLYSSRKFCFVSLSSSRPSKNGPKLSAKKSSLSISQAKASSKYGFFSSFMNYFFCLHCCFLFFLCCFLLSKLTSSSLKPSLFPALDLWFFFPLPLWPLRFLWFLLEGLGISISSSRRDSFFDTFWSTAWPIVSSSSLEN